MAKKKAKAKKKKKDAPVRDKRGRLLPGHNLKDHCKEGRGPGNPWMKRLKEYREAIRAAVSPEDVVIMLKRLKEFGKKGDTAAIQIWLNRIMGKPRNEPIFVEGIKLDLPKVTDKVTAREAMHRVLSAVNCGEITIDVGESLFKMLKDAASTFIEEEGNARKAELIESLKTFIDDLDAATAPATKGKE